MLNEEREWPLLLRCLKREDINDDKRFNTREDRAKNSLELMRILDEEFLSKDWGQLKELFEKSGVTFGSISEPYDHINDQQIADNEFFTKFTDKKAIMYLKRASKVKLVVSDEFPGFHFSSLPVDVRFFSENFLLCHVISTSK